MTGVQFEMQTKTVDDIINLFRSRRLDLEPAFQRSSVWAERDRAKLIDSVLRGYPLPAVFFHRRTDKHGNMVYSVIDGKQRIESILRFCGVMRGAFSASVTLPDSESSEDITWAKLNRRQAQFRLTGYKLQVTEVQGDLAEVIDLFVRINSTGKALTSQEKLHARYYQSEFLSKAARIAAKLEPRLVQAKVISASQVTRKKHVELVCELMLSAHQGDVIHKKAALAGIMESKNITKTQVAKAEKAVIGAVNRVFKVLPDLRTTRFRQLADFYSLVVLLLKYEREGLTVADRRSLALAKDILVAFSSGVDEVQARQRTLQGVKPSEQLLGDYLLTVKEGTDALSNRKRREQILDGLLRPLFEAKDEKRIFSPEQRRFLWHTTAERRCGVCKCRLTWDDFTIDHIHPHSKGGRTAIENAALLCRRHNSSKGNR